MCNACAPRCQTQLPSDDVLTTGSIQKQHLTCRSSCQPDLPYLRDMTRTDGYLATSPTIGDHFRWGWSATPVVAAGVRHGHGQGMCYVGYVARSVAVTVLSSCRRTDQSAGPRRSPWFVRSFLAGPPPRGRTLQRQEAKHEDAKQGKKKGGGRGAQPVVRVLRWY